jgi:hypothetical protein
VTLIPAHGWHLDMMKLSDAVRDVLGKYPSSEIIENLGQMGLAHTAVIDEGDEVRILGVMGAVPMGEGAVEVFAVVDESRRHNRRLAFVKAVRQLLDRAQERFAIIEAVAAEGVPSKWFESLGFENTGAGRWRLAGERS